MRYIYLPGQETVKINSPGEPLTALVATLSISRLYGLSE